MSNLEQDVLQRVQLLEQRLVQLEQQLEQRVQNLLQQHFGSGVPQAGGGQNFGAPSGNVDPNAVNQANQQFVDAQQSNLDDNGQLGQPNPGTQGTQR